MRLLGTQLLLGTQPQPASLAGAVRLVHGPLPHSAAGTRIATTPTNPLASPFACRATPFLCRCGASAAAPCRALHLLSSLPRYQHGCLPPVLSPPQVWGLTDGLHRRSMMCPSSCNSLAITTDGSLVASGHFDGTLRFWDLRTGRVAHEVAGLHSPHGGITSVDTGSRWAGAGAWVNGQSLNALGAGRKVAWQATAPACCERPPVEIRAPAQPGSCRPMLHTTRLYLQWRLGAHLWQRQPAALRGRAPV